jgi:hypothetical protein
VFATTTTPPLLLLSSSSSTDGGIIVILETLCVCGTPQTVGTAVVVQEPTDWLDICFDYIRHGAVYVVRIGHHTHTDIIRSAPLKSQEIAVTDLVGNVLVLTVASYRNEQQLKTRHSSRKRAQSM